MKTLEQEIRAAGLGVTRVRVALLKTLRSHCAPMTAESLGEAVTQSGAPVGRASLYRNMEAFSRAGLIERIEGGKDGNRYISCCHASTHHHHIVCEQCHQTVPIDACVSRSTVASVETKTGFTVTSHSLLFYGICATCAKKSATRSSRCTSKDHS